MREWYLQGLSVHDAYRRARIFGGSLSVSAGMTGPDETWSSRSITTVAGHDACEGDALSFELVTPNIWTEEYA